MKSLQDEITDIINPKTFRFDNIKVSKIIDLFADRMALDPSGTVAELRRHKNDVVKNQMLVRLKMNKDEFEKIMEQLGYIRSEDVDEPSDTDTNSFTNKINNESTLDVIDDIDEIKMCTVRLDAMITGTEVINELKKRGFVAMVTTINRPDGTVNGHYDLELRGELEQLEAIIFHMWADRDLCKLITRIEK